MRFIKLFKKLRFFCFAGQPHFIYSLRKACINQWPHRRGESLRRAQAILSWSLYIFFIFLLIPKVVAASDFEELKGDHFIVYYQTKKSFAEKVLSQSEKYYDSLAKKLGYSRYDNFWTWDNRCKIFIYKDDLVYQAKTGAQEWSAGFAILNKREIHTFGEQIPFLKNVLPHELAHLMLVDFIGLEKELSLWLHEGIAMSAEESRREQMLKKVRTSILSHQWIPLEELIKVKSLHAIADKKLVEIFYTASFAYVDFLIDYYPTDRFKEFCRDLKEGYEAGEALRRNYHYYDLNGISDLHQKAISYYTNLSK